jgi:hypothetical protein
MTFLRWAVLKGRRAGERNTAAGTENRQEAGYVGLRIFRSFASKHFDLFKSICQV